jgi:hypothetical protein
MRAVAGRGGPDIGEQTLRIHDLRALVIEAHEACLRHREPPLVVPPGTARAAPPAGEEWADGTEVAVAGGAFLVHEPVAVDTSPDRAHAFQRAKARQLEPAARDVWLEQVRLLRATEEGQRRQDALRAEAALLRSLASVADAPRLIRAEETGETMTLVLAMPAARPLPEALGRPGTAYPGIAADALLRGMPPLCAVLGELHERGHAHRALSPDGLLVTTPGGRVVLRDLGLATVAPSPGEGPGGYRAPEQERPLLHPPGPHTDVYQVAAILYHLLTGHLPRVPAVRPTVLRPELSAELDAVLPAALDPDPQQRPSIRRLSSQLRQVARRGTVMPR